MRELLRGLGLAVLLVLLVLLVLTAGAVLLDRLGTFDRPSPAPAPVPAIAIARGDR